MSTDLSTLNAQQKDAVEKSIEHNVVLLAGAGSGKTHTLIARTEYLIDDMNVDPYNIMLVTFTNKAAQEMKDRIAKVSNQTNKMWVGTFHSICVKLMRMHGEPLGVNKFTIMDTNDTKKLIKEIISKYSADTSSAFVSYVISRISYYKNNVIRPAKVLTDSNESNIIASIYQDYQNTCWRMKSFDFDDLIIYTIVLLSNFPEIAEWVHNRFKYVMVDECQDTNSAQFRLIKLLVGDNNVMLIGDVNQSIYAFRNAKPQYLERFAKRHPNTIKMKLEQNYRSTKNIINAANKVITNNEFGTKLKMFCNNEDGEPIHLCDFDNPWKEAEWIASEISFGKKDFSDYAIIYRANYQSRIIEEALNNNGIPYTVFGATSFYARKESKDLLAWLKLNVNHNDKTSFERVLNSLRGVGKKTVSDIVKYATKSKKTYVEALISSVAKDSRCSDTLQTVHMILTTEHTTNSKLIEDILHYTTYRDYLERLGTDDSLDRVQIIDEFERMILATERDNPTLSMENIVDNVALLSETKSKDKESLNVVKLMTAHSSKGLEFDTVFIAGAEEGTFPHINAIKSHKKSDIEEERRLFYVAMTRAEKELYITYSNMRVNNKSDRNEFTKSSRFIAEIPDNLIEETY